MTANANPFRVLLVDDLAANLDVMRDLLESEGYKVLVALDGPTALKSAARALPDLILLDVVMPAMDGFETCRRLKAVADTAKIPVIFLTANDQNEAVVEGFEAGGVDYITKPFREKEVLVRLRTHLSINRLGRELSEKNAALQQKNLALEEEILQRQRLKGRLSMISQEETRRWGLEGFIGQSPTMGRILSEVRLMQTHVTPGVLITGESGTGKELIARAIHFGSARREGPFVPVNCAAVPAELWESLFFGHRRGAFTGAEGDQVGYFEMANGGSLFLDEVGEMPAALQAKLLRVLEDSLVRRLGESQDRRVEVRVLAATNADLQEKIQAGVFRQDLFYRLARFTVEVPPLRKRGEDIPLLAQHFLRIAGEEFGLQAPSLSLEGLEALQEYDFPGNVRELKNIIERALLESGGAEIRTAHLRFPAAANMTNPVAVSEIPLNLEAAELWLTRQAMARTGDNIAEAARLLGTSRGKTYRILARENPGSFPTVPK